jgi:hypothetical protein
MSCAGTRWPVRRVLAFGSGSAGVVETVPGPRRDSAHQSEPAPCRANFSSRPGADRCPRPCCGPGSGRGPGDDGVRCGVSWALPFPAELVLLRIGFVLDVLTHRMWEARRHRGVAGGTPVPASHLETPAPGRPGAGVRVSSRAWRRDHDRDAHGRAATPWLTPERAVWIRGIPWLSSAAWSAPAPLPEPWRKGSSAHAVWRCTMS